MLRFVHPVRIANVSLIIMQIYCGKERGKEQRIGFKMIYRDSEKRRWVKLTPHDYTLFYNGRRKREYSLKNEPPRGFKIKNVWILYFPHHKFLAGSS